MGNRDEYPLWPDARFKKLLSIPEDSVSVRPFRAVLLFLQSGQDDLHIAGGAEGCPLWVHDVCPVVCRDSVLTADRADGHQFMHRTVPVWANLTFHPNTVFVEAVSPRRTPRQKLVSALRGRAWPREPRLVDFKAARFILVGLSFATGRQIHARTDPLQKVKQ